MLAFDSVALLNRLDPTVIPAFPAAHLPLPFPAARPGTPPRPRPATAANRCARAGWPPRPVGAFADASRAKPKFPSGNKSPPTITIITVTVVTTTITITA